ncbi:MAG: lipopolysaccharide transport periplasmic protein LptA [Gammaproteobacteria bacterium]|nr:lipopolysaccharide transport periplasmic protein LptA [Gammaproteobacteria bacterium]
MHPSTVSIVPLLLTVLFPASAVALSSDRQQPMHIEADRADLDDQKGISVYRGNVVITQGTLRLTADELTVYTRDGEVTKAFSTGAPATYRQRPDGKDQDVEAQSLRMEYYAGEEKIILLQKAEVKQAGDTFRSDKIIYDIARDHVNAGTGTPGDRVRITIQPKRQEEGTRD